MWGEKLMTKTVDLKILAELLGVSVEELILASRSEHLIEK